MPEVTHGSPLSEQQFAVLKMYAKIDNTIEDDLLDVLISGSATQIANAIHTGVSPEQLLQTRSTRDRFFTAIMQQVKEQYDNRGESADVMRYPLVDTVSAIVNQLRTEVD